MSKQWDKIFKEEGKVFVEPHEEMQRVVKIFKKNKVRRVLDLGCGSGRHLVYLAKNGFEVYGIDIANYGIKIARDWLKEENLKAELKIGNIYKKLPYPDKFFDGIVSVATLHHNRIEKIRKLIKEIERILKPKGLIFITVSKKRTKKELKKMQKDEIWKIKMIAPRTYVPISGREKGLIHFWFNKTILRREFKNFKIHKIWTEKSKKHYCLLAERKNTKQDKA
ncbi:MAG: class I SAM-dependent methyltransferase [Candidatus Aenigmarchaeota archaeon]|nr:class I SAM-dependent methyltransferase [Candidatus Aenigmarchaeota archaeon]